MDKLDLVAGDVVKLVGQMEMEDKELVALAAAAVAADSQEMAPVIVLERVFSMEGQVE